MAYCVSKEEGMYNAALADTKRLPGEVAALNKEVQEANIDLRDNILDLENGDGPYGDALLQISQKFSDMANKVSGLFTEHGFKSESAGKMTDGTEKNSADAIRDTQNTVTPHINVG